MEGRHHLRSRQYPVSLYSVSETGEDISFRQLYAKDQAPIQYRRLCQAEGVEVPWEEIVKGYEYEKASSW